MNRRLFLKTGSLGAAAIGLASVDSGAAAFGLRPRPPFDISLAEWSLHQHLEQGKMTNLDFPVVARKKFGIGCVEFVDQFFADKARDTKYLNELKKRARGEGVRCNLIMVDTNGPLGAADAAERKMAVEKTYQWIDAAKHLGCATVRVNAYGEGSADDLRGRVAESCSTLADYAAGLGVKLVIENHGGLSSDATWLVSLMKAVNKPNFGALPDFGNFEAGTNRYDAIEAMMPHALAVSAKSERFSPDGQVVDTDFHRMMRIVRDGGYAGFVGIESAPAAMEEEHRAIEITRDTLRRIQEDQAQCQPIFNGKSLRGWTAIEGGEWSIEEGVLVGRRGINWTTNPEKTGSWLSTKREYSDFRLELQYMVNKGGNSGIFFRSSHQKNPAFTGFEVQIYDAPGRPPSKTGPGSLYDVVAPTSNPTRPAGQWNTVTLIASGPHIRVEMNGEKILETEQTRSSRGYIGLQNHDDKSEIRFRNIRLAEL